MIEIEFEEPNKSVCECCGGITTSLTRFVYEDGDAFAIYYAKFSDNHPECAVVGVISIGEWGTDDPPKNRVAFPFRIWQTDEQWNVVLTDSDDSPWKGIELLGKMLDRHEALEHTWKRDVFHITDHMVIDDTEIVNFFKLDSSFAN